MTTWNDHFLDLFTRCEDRYRNGDTDYTQYYDRNDRALLASIGYQPREFFDFVEDYCEESEPSPSTALLIAAVRRDYFRVIMNGQTAEPLVTHDTIPAKPDEFDGIPYLPRILAKARGKLRGALDPDLMFCCGGDRGFLHEHGLHPADFLRQVWAAGDDDSQVASWIRNQNQQA